MQPYRYLDRWPIPGYRPVAPVGRGAFAEVYRATSDRGDVAAVKIFHGPDAARAIAEARALLGVLSHTNLVAVREYCPGGGGTPPYIIMEYVPGETLDARIRRGPVPPAEAHAIARQIVSGLAHLHDAGFVHGDLKPSNVLIAPGGIVKLADVGVGEARLLDRSGGEMLRSSLGVSIGTERSEEGTGRVAVTPAYLAPEVLAGAPPAAAADQYALALVLHEMLSGEERPAFRTPLAERGIPGAASIDALIERATRRDPRDRFLDIRSLGLALDAAFAGAAGGRGPGSAGAAALSETVADLLAEGLEIPDALWDRAALLARRLAFRAADVERLVAGAGSEILQPGYGLVLSALLASLPATVPPTRVRLAFPHLRRPLDFLAAFNPGHAVLVEGPTIFFAYRMRRGGASLDGSADRAAEGLEGGIVRIRGTASQVGEGMRGGTVDVCGPVRTIGPGVSGGRIRVAGDVREILGVEGGRVEVSGRTGTVDPASRRFIEPLLPDPGLDAEILALFGP